MASIDELKSDYAAKLSERNVLYEQMKPISKELKKIEKQIKEYMKENEIDSLVVGPHVFESQTRKKLKISIEDLESILPEGVAIDDYMHTSSSISKKRKKEESAE